MYRIEKPLPDETMAAVKQALRDAAVGLGKIDAIELLQGAEWAYGELQGRLGTPKNRFDCGPQFFRGREIVLGFQR